MSAWAQRMRAAREEDGFTLVELLVSMIMLGIVGLIVAQAASVALKTNADSEVLVTKSADAQTAMDRVTRSLRAALDPVYDGSTSPVTFSQGFVSTGPFAVTFYTNVKDLASNGATLIPQLVTDQVVPDPAHTGSYELTETVTPGVANASAPPAYVWNGASSTHVLAYGLAAPSGSTPSLFTYYQPTYYDQGTSADILVGTGNCASAAPVAPTVNTAAGVGVAKWVGAQPNTTIATAIGSIRVTLTLVGRGTNAPQFSTTDKTVTTTSTVDIDAANNFLSRDGTCQ